MSCHVCVCDFLYVCMYTEAPPRTPHVPQVKGPRAVLELVCHTEMQRIDGHAQTPLQLARVDDRHRAKTTGCRGYLGKCLVSCRLNEDFGSKNLVK